MVIIVFIALLKIVLKTVLKNSANGIDKNDRSNIL